MFRLLVSKKTGRHCATMFSSVAARGSHSVDTLARSGKLCREVAFEWPEITWAWVENTNICYTVQESFDFLEMKKLSDLGPISGKWQHWGIHTLTHFSLKVWLLFKGCFFNFICLVERFSQSNFHFCFRIIDYHRNFKCAIIMIFRGTYSRMTLTS